MHKLVSSLKFGSISKSAVGQFKTFTNDDEHWLAKKSRHQNSVYKRKLYGSHFINLYYMTLMPIESPPLKMSLSIISMSLSVVKFVVYT